MTTDTPRTDACPHCGSSFSKAIGKHSCHFDLETSGRTKLCLTAEALIRASNQNTELKAEIEQLNIAGATAVEAAKIFKQRAEKAEAEVERLRKILKQFTEGSELALDAIQQSGRWCFETQAETRRILKEALLELNPDNK